MDHDQRLTLLDLRADLADLGDADRGVERTVLEGGEETHALGDLAGVDGVHVAALRGGQLADELGLGELRRIVDPVGLAALGADHRLELLEGGTVLEVLLDGLLGGKGRTGDAGEAHDLHAQLEDEVLQVFGAFALQEADGFEDFEARADGVAEGLVDVGHEGHALAVERAGDAGDDAGELLGLLEVADEGTVAPLYVDHQAFAAFGELLGEDAARDEREGRDRARLLAERVEDVVGRGDLAALLGDGATHALELLAELVHRGLALEARDRAELLDGREAELLVLAVHAGHDDAGGGAERAEHHGSLVAHAAGRDLGDLGLGETVEVDDVARETEFFGQEGGLLRGHLLEIDRHREGGLLRLRHLGVHDRVDDMTDLVGGELAAIPLLLDERGEGGLLLTLVVQDFLCHK